jgi:peptidoglycan hydrolase CwlO-like protein
MDTSHLVWSVVNNGICLEFNVVDTNTFSTYTAHFFEADFSALSLCHTFEDLYKILTLEHSPIQVSFEVDPDGDLMINLTYSIGKDHTTTFGLECKPTVDKTISTLTHYLKAITNENVKQKQQIAQLTNKLDDLTDKVRDLQRTIEEGMQSEIDELRYAIETCTSGR